MGHAYKTTTTTTFLFIFARTKKECYYDYCYWTNGPFLLEIFFVFVLTCTVSHNNNNNSGVKNIVKSKKQQQQGNHFVFLEETNKNFANALTRQTLKQCKNCLKK